MSRGCGRWYELRRTLLLFEVDLFVLVASDAGADLGGRPSGLGLEIGVEAFGGADVALGAVDGLVAAMQAGVAEGPVAAAVARQLINDARDLRRQLIGAHLPVVAEVRSLELRAVEDGRNGLDVERRGRVIGRNVFGRVRPLRIAGGGECGDGQTKDPAAVDRVTHEAPHCF